MFSENHNIVLWRHMSWVLHFSGLHTSCILSTFNLLLADFTPLGCRGWYRYWGTRGSRGVGHTHTHTQVSFDSLQQRQHFSTWVNDSAWDITACCPLAAPSRDSSQWVIACSYSSHSWKLLMLIMRIGFVICEIQRGKCILIIIIIRCEPSNDSNSSLRHNIA
jgi:hypothetical protein